MKKLHSRKYPMFNAEPLKKTKSSLDFQGNGISYIAPWVNGHCLANALSLAGNSHKEDRASILLRYTLVP